MVKSHHMNTWFFTLENLMEVGYFPLPKYEKYGSVSLNAVCQLNFCTDLTGLTFPRVKIYGLSGKTLPGIYQNIYQKVREGDSTIVGTSILSNLPRLLAGGIGHRGGYTSKYSKAFASLRTFLPKSSIPCDLPYALAVTMAEVSEGFTNPLSVSFQCPHTRRRSPVDVLTAPMVYDVTLDGCLDLTAENIGVHWKFYIGRARGARIVTQSELAIAERAVEKYSEFKNGYPPRIRRYR